MAEEPALVQIQIMWSRDGNLDTRPNAVFQPNHFVPVLALTNLADVHAKNLKYENLQPTKKKPCKRDISSFFKSANEDTSSLANKTAKDDSSGSKRKNESEPPTSTKKTSRKFLPHWKDDFPWIIYDEEESVIIFNHTRKIRVCERLQSV